jgi:hypothetical protein
MALTIAADTTQRSESSSQISSSDSFLKPISRMPSWPEVQASIRGERHNFQYTPLDYSRHSIRSIRIIPKSIRWHNIQCDVQHTTIDEAVHSYVCLSYVWCETRGTSISPSTAQQPGCSQTFGISYMLQEMYIPQSLQKPCQNGYGLMHCASTNRMR